MVGLRTILVVCEHVFVRWQELTVENEEGRRLPGYRDVTAEQWESAQWQRAHSVKNLKELKAALGDHLTDDLTADIQRDMFERATMSVEGGPAGPNVIRVTHVYRREEGQWKIVHRHGDASFMSEPSLRPPT